jgi:hypothetical protein
MKAASANQLEFSNFSVKTQTKNLAEDCLDSIKHVLPATASIRAVLQRKAPRLFETKIGINIWHKYIFCKSTGLNPAVSLQNAKRKILRQIKDLRNRKFADKRHHSSPRDLEFLQNEDNQYEHIQDTAATLAEIL